MMILEGGNVFGGGDIPREAVPGIIKQVQRDMPTGLKVIPDIGSAGYKVASGDLDLFVDAELAQKKFQAADEKATRKLLGEFFAAKGYQVKLSGRNVHIAVPYDTEQGQHMAQVDLMVIQDAARVAPWHQHGPRGMYSDPGFKAGHLYIVLNSIAKALGLKVDAFSGKVLKRDDNSVVADNRDDAAKILLNPSATGDDLNSVKSVLTALKNDPNRDAKLAQAIQDAEKGIITLPENVTPGTTNWFRSWANRL
jgi:hypothetical protein